MSASTELASPQEVELGKLFPLSLYEIGLLERSYSAAMRREAIESTIGLPDERDKAMQAAADKVGELALTVAPVLLWVQNTYEGRIIAIKHCMDANVSHRDVARWIHSKGGMQCDEVVQWEVDSGLRSDPTEEESTQETDSPPQTQENEPSKPAPSDGSTEYAEATQP